MRRSWVLSLAIGLCLIALTPAAGAKAPAARGRGGIDRSFGGNGFVRPQNQIPGYDASSAFAMAIAPNQKIYLLERAFRCDRGCFQGTFLVRLLPNGHLDRTFATGSVLLPAATDGYETKIAVDAKGRVWILANEKGVVSIVRLLPGGGFDPAFGDGGRVSVSCEVCEDAHLSLRPDPRGGALIWGSRADPLSPPYPSSLPSPQRLLLLSVADNGDLEQGFGEGGRSELVLEKANEPGAIFLDREGAVTLAGGWQCCASPEGIYVERFRADGSLDLDFSQQTAQDLASLGMPMQGHINSVAAIVAGARGKLTLFGASDGRGYVLRIRHDGTLDRSFGLGGLRWLRWPLRTVVPAGGGRLWAVTSSLAVRGALALRLSRDGRVDRTFGGKYFTVGLPRWSPFGVSIGRQGSRGVLFTPGYRSCRSYCPPKPMLARVVPAPRPHSHHHGRHHHRHHPHH